jgi:hypothetical protein
MVLDTSLQILNHLRITLNVNYVVDCKFAIKKKKSLPIGYWRNGSLLPLPLKRLQRLVSAETRLAKPLPSYSSPFRLQYSGFQAARHTAPSLRLFVSNSLTASRRSLPS